MSFNLGLNLMGLPQILGGYNPPVSYDPTWLSNFTLLPQDADGYSELTPVTGSANPVDDSRIYYVDPTNGNDATAQYYSGTEFADVRNPTGELAYQDITVAEALLRDGYPDWLVVKKGEEAVLSGHISVKSGKNNDERMTYATYGVSSDRPLLKTVAGISAFDVRAQRFFNIVGFEAYAYQKDPESPDYVGWVNTGASTAGINGFDGSGGDVSGDFLIEDNNLRHYGSGISLQCYSDTTIRTNCVIRRNIIDKVYHSVGGGHAQGFWAMRASVLLEENNFYHCGWYDTLDNKSTLAVALTGAAETQVVMTDAIPADRPQAGEIYVKSDNATVTYLTYTSWSGSTYTIPSTDFTTKPAAIGSDAGTPYHKPSIYSHSIYNAYMYQSIYRRNNFIDSASIGIKFTSNPLTGVNEILTNEVAIYENVIYGGEIGMSPSGNDSFDDGYRWSNYLINHNVIIATGIRMPTERDIAYGITFSDHTNSEARDNLLLHIDNPSITNIVGISNDGVSDNVTLSSNKIYAYGGDVSDTSGGSNIVVSNNSKDLNPSDYVDPTRKIETYMTSLGQVSSVDTLISKCLAMNPSTYDSDYSAKSIVNYLDAGYAYSSDLILVNDLVGTALSTGDDYTASFEVVSDYTITYKYYIDGVLDATRTNSSETFTNIQDSFTLRCDAIANGTTLSSSTVNVTVMVILTLNGVDAYLSFPLETFTDGFDISAVINATAAVNNPMFAESIGSYYFHTILWGSSDAQFNFGSWSSVLGGWVVGTEYVLRIVRVSGTDLVEMLLNGSVVADATVTGSVKIGTFGQSPYGSFNGSVRNISYSGDGVAQTTFLLNSGALDGQTEESVEGGKFITMHNPTWS